MTFQITNNTIFLGELGASPASPPDTGHWFMYFLSDGIYIMDDTGAETGPLGSGSGTVKGRVEFVAAVPPTTVGAPLTALVGASSPAEQFPYFEFVNGTITYRDYLCRLVGYSGGGLTFKFEVMKTTASTGDAYVFELAIRKIYSSENLANAQTYDYNQLVLTVPAISAELPMECEITFTDGADMDGLIDTDLFLLRFRRNATHASDTATDVARVLASLTGRET